MEQLKFAINQAGGVLALAHLLGITQPRISNWISRDSVPDGWLAVLTLKFPMPNSTPAQAGRAVAATETVALGVANV